MTDFEHKILEKSKQENCVLTEEEMNELEQLDPIDALAISTIIAFRANLKNKEDEGKALWRFIRYLTEIEMPMRMVDFTGMLFPNNEEYYEKVVTPTAFKVIQQQATLMVANNKYENEEHKEWLQKIADGKLPYGYSIQITKEENENE